MDVYTNRAAQKYNNRVLLGRIAWKIISPFFHLSPRPFWLWRRLLLRAFGATVGKGAHIYPSVRIAMPWNVQVGELSAIGDRAIIYALGRVTIGSRATVSQYAHLCAGSHDLNRPDRQLVKATICVGSGAWIAADAFVGPGVIVGDGAVVGARAVVMQDVRPGEIVVGNPARTLRRVQGG